MLSMFYAVHFFFKGVWAMTTVSPVDNREETFANSNCDKHMQKCTPDT